MTALADVAPIGLGTWNMADDPTCAEAVQRALACGYRHVDTAQLYDTEAAVGTGLARSDVAAQEVFVATKVDPENLGYDDLIDSVRRSRARLGVDCIDCCYVHWPRSAYDPAETLPALAHLVEDGVVGAVGLSNFTTALLDQATDRLDCVVAHQVECHPYCQQSELRSYAAQSSHRLVAYSPLARGTVLDDPVVRSVASAHDTTAAVVTLAWLRAHDVVPIPKATGPHIEENLAALSLSLSDPEVARIDAIDTERRLVDPPSAPWN